MHLAAKLALASLVPVSLLAGKSWWGCGTCPTSSQAAAAAAAQPVTGDYVEARSASVFAGACHYGSEYTTQGREAVLAWELTGGVVEGVSLAGVEVVAVVTADRNLAEADARRASIVYLDESLAPATRAAVLAWLEREHGDALGEVRKAKTGAVSVDCGGERYSVNALGLVRLAGEALPDRACCSMPSNVWYEPQVALRERVVGQSEVFAVSDPDVGPPFERHSENDAFLGPLAASAQGACDAAGPQAEAGCCPPEAAAQAAP